MLRIRRFEEKAAELYTVGKIRGFLHLYIGEEAVAVGAMQALTADDAIVSTYREHGHALARGIPAGPLMAEMYGKANGLQPGPRRFDALFDVSRRFYGGNAIVGGGLPIAVGLALADKLQGRARVTACFFGDGAVAEGEFHESLNLAALVEASRPLPVREQPIRDGDGHRPPSGPAGSRAKAESSGLRRRRWMGWTSSRSRRPLGGSQTRSGSDSVRIFSSSETYRFRAHSMYDPELYRTKEEVEQWKTRDPIAVFATRLREWRLLSDSDLAALETAVAGEVEDAVRVAEEGPWEPVEDLTRDVCTPSATP